MLRLVFFAKSGLECGSLLPPLYRSTYRWESVSKLAHSREPVIFGTVFHAPERTR